MPESFLSIFGVVVIGDRRERERRGAGVLVFLVRAQSRIFPLSSICEVTRQMIRMVIFKGYVSFLDEVVIFREQQREQENFSPHCLRTAREGRRGDKADGQIRDNSRSRCPYPTLGHILHLSDLAALYFPWRCSNCSMQMEKSVFQEKKKKENIECASTMAHDKGKKASRQSTG